ncbi:MAG: hypothetical protein KME13_16920 [Myxacorys californica WJT36-NPBG1]|jgi:hypothetical protein|nr:hypothetical protein [Myxacorys californica WJT36-NPBG1]
MNPPDRFTLELDADHPNLLRGLDVLLDLGLLTQQQIEQLSRQHLTCLLPEAVESPTRPIAALGRSSSPDFVTSTPDFVTSTRAERPERVAPSENVITRILRSLQQELSVVWLLVLGVFLVVVSSAVLAASQWQAVSPTGQYLVLLGYTVSFWGASFWANRRPNLRLTATTLQTLTLLLVPVNFWAIDRFLLQFPQVQSISIAAVAAIVLSAIAVLLLKASSNFNSRFVLSYLGLSYLQLGWSVSVIPPIAIYLGSLLLVIAPILALSRFALLGSAIALLFLRAVFVTNVDVAQLGLAVALCGGGVARLAHRRTGSTGWRLSGALLLLGWLVSVGSVPWQALAASCIAIFVSYQALQRFWRRFDVALLLAIELQMLWLVWRLIPASLQTQIVDSVTRITDTELSPIALLGIALFPYLIVILAFSLWLQRRQQPQLANFSEGIALGFGVLLFAISAIAPATRTLNLFASTVTLAWLLRQRRSRQQDIVSLVYATHLGGLATIISAIQYRFPALNSSTWALLFLSIAIAQWMISAIGSRSIWQRSAWHVGPGFATLSYVLWVEPLGSAPPIASSWLAVPLALTLIAARRPEQQQIAAQLSAIALGMAQLLTLNRPETGLLGLVCATVLMVGNTRLLPHPLFANLTIGYGLTALGWGLWHQLPGMRQIDVWLLVGATVLLLLWLGTRWGQTQLTQGETAQQPSRLIALFVQVANRWAAVLSALLLFGSGLQVLRKYADMQAPTLIGLAAIALTTGVLAARAWRTTSMSAVIGLGLGIELLVAHSLAWGDPSIIRLSVANVGLGLATQLADEIRRRQAPSESIFGGWYGLPLAYGIGAIGLRLGTFEAWTGCISLGVALIFIGVGRQRSAFRSLTFLGLFGLSIGLSELVLYPLRNESLSNQLMAIAALGTVLTLVYRYLLIEKLNYLHLSAVEIKSVAHGHWAISSVVLSVAASLTLLISAPGTLALIGFITGVGLSLYAIFQARRHPNLRSAEIWLYAGLLEAAALVWYLSTKPWFSGVFAQLRPYAVAIAAIVAFVIFVLPWERLGWMRRPWQRVSIVVPLLALAGTATIVHGLSLIVLAVFYSLIASIRREIRWTYLSMALLNWVVFKQLDQLNLNILFWQVLPVGLSILYFAAVEPSLKLAQAQSSKHYVRLCGTSLICITALLTQNNYGILPGLVSLIAIFAGLGLKIRAFLYVGTIVFCLNVLYQLVVLATTYSLLKWVIGLCIGIVLIWIAANFETRRGQVTTLMQTWLEQLQAWE